MFELSAGPFKDWMPAIITGFFSIIVLFVTSRSKKGAEIRGRDWERERVVRTEVEKAREIELAQGITQGQDLTARFRTLMEGYENRIKDITSELAMRKAEHEKLERLYDERMLLCNVCPKYHEHLRDLNARTPS